MRLAIAGALALALLAAGAAVAYWLWITSPQYSLSQAKRAIDRRDAAAFQKYVDIEAVASSALDQLLAASIAAAGGGQQDAWQQLRDELARRAFAAAKPALVQVLKGQVIAAIEQGTFARPSPSEAGTDTGAQRGGQGAGDVDFSLAALYHALGGERLQFNGIDYVHIDGEVAFVGLALADRESDATMVLELKMLDRGRHWQVVEVTNLGPLLRRAPDLVADLLFGRAQARAASLLSRRAQEVAADLLVRRVPGLVTGLR